MEQRTASRTSTAPRTGEPVGYPQTSEKRLLMKILGQHLQTEPLQSFLSEGSDSRRPLPRRKRIVVGLQKDLPFHVLREEGAYALPPLTLPPRSFISIRAWTLKHSLRRFPKTLFTPKRRIQLTERKTHNEELAPLLRAPWPGTSLAENPWNGFSKRKRSLRRVPLPSFTHRSRHLVQGRRLLSEVPAFLTLRVV